MDLFLLSMVLCLVAGAAVDTGSVCVVRAVNEAVAGKATQALGLLSTLLAASLVFFVDTAMHWHLRQPPWAWPSALMALGAAVFAVGAVVNGACAMGTITRLCRGDVGYIATLAGAVAITLVVPRTMLPADQTPAGIHSAGIEWLGVVLLLTLVPMLLLRAHVSVRVCLSFAVMGLIAAVLANLRGDWTWLRVIQRVQQGLPIQLEIVGGIGAILAGATTMALYRHRFRLIRPDPRAMVREAIGGGLMALGAVLIPGGNDVLLVYGLPSGSPHAIVSYIIILTFLVVLLRMTGPVRRWLAWPMP